MRLRAILCAVAVLAVLFGGAANATTTLLLSDTSSDETPASDLSALLTLAVSDSTLTVTVENQTQLTTSGYNITELYFSTSINASDLILTGANGSQDGDNFADWALYASTNGQGSPTMADGFGKFDWAVKDGVNGDPSTIEPSEVQIFTFSFTCLAGVTCTSADFGTELSTGQASNGRQLAAAMFVSGPGDDSAFGGTTTVPEPETAALLILGLLALGAKRRLTR